MDTPVAIIRDVHEAKPARAVQVTFGGLALATVGAASALFSYVWISTSTAGRGMDARALGFAILWPIVTVLITFLGAFSLTAGKRAGSVPLFVIATIAGAIACWFAVLRLVSAPGLLVAALFLVFSSAFAFFLVRLSARRSCLRA